MRQHLRWHYSYHLLLSCGKRESIFVGDRVEPTNRHLMWIPNTDLLGTVIAAIDVGHGIQVVRVLWDRWNDALEDGDEEGRSMSSCAGKHITYYGYHGRDIHTVDGGMLAVGKFVYFGSYRDETEGLVVQIGTTDSGEDYITVLWNMWTDEPFVRRVFSPLVAQDLVDVQPMTAPAGGIFYIDFKYGDDKK